MTSGQRLLTIRSASLAALTVSATLWAASLHSKSPMCGFDSDCGEVLSSPFSKPLGVPLPVVGVLMFSSIFACTLSGSSFGLSLLRWLSLLAGIGGVSLILVQVFAIHHLCPLCLFVDACAIPLAAIVYLRRDESAVRPSNRARFLWVTMAATASIVGAELGTVGGRLVEDDDNILTPPQISANWVADKVTIVEITDFQCPHCRRMHRLVSSFLRAEKDRIHFVRIVAPISNKHPQARDAARAYLSAQALGKGEEMAEKLFAADDLTPAACARMAASLGLSPGEYQAGVAAPETDRALDENLAWVVPACPRGLPCLWVQDQRLSGLSSVAALPRVVTLAEQRLGKSNP
jgi:uncharacterized membrane protein/predicted DsbA family dithiol-disulfide isomerase